jgi:hypothetical protein
MQRLGRAPCRDRDSDGAPAQGRYCVPLAVAHRDAAEHRGRVLLMPPASNADPLSYIAAISAAFTQDVTAFPSELVK